MNRRFRYALSQTCLTLLLGATITDCLAETSRSAIPPAIVKNKPVNGRYVAVENGYMVPYKQPIPGTKHFLWMEPIPGTASHEKATRKTIAPFWIARFETRHADYLPYMRLNQTFKTFAAKHIRPVTNDNRINAVTAPTEIYDEHFAFEYGVDLQQPVGTMTLFCARQYTKWLSKLTETDFRLPTATEWEHACAAGTKTVWHCGDDPQVLKEYACFGDQQAIPGYQKVGLRKPNAWGLFDMHGNMAEWVLQPGITKTNLQILKGGCWEFPAEKCRTSSILKFDAAKFRDEDPNLPQSAWWLASFEARWVGFRIMRPLKPMTIAERKFAWEYHNEDESADVEGRLEEGRATIGIVDAQLPSAIKRFTDSKKTEQR